jgi:phosphohistidine swiveling domain-containing protein
MKYVWDNSNIVESYPGICSPLTFSFARYVYREVYLQTAPLFGVERRVIEALYRRLETFLGYCDGRFYYNLETWCSLISYLPGFGENPRLLQEMMGVRPEDRLQIPRVTVPRLAKVRLLAKALYYHFALPGLTERWIAEFDANFRASRLQLEPIGDGHAAMLFFFDLEQLYLRNWKIPILNDFAVMIYSGFLRQLSRRFLKTELAPNQIAGIGESGNVRMVADLIRIAQAIKDDLALNRDCLTLEPEAVWARLQAQPVVWSLIERFLGEFGLRNGHDLKLETANFREEPARLVALLQQYLQAGPRARGAATPSQAAKAPVPPLPFLQRIIVDFFSLHTRRAIGRREEMRIKRSQVYGMAREIFLKIGAAFAAQGLLDCRDDIFFLEMDEVFGVLRGTATLRNVQVLVAQRRSELAAAAAHEIPAHFTTEGIPFRAAAQVAANSVVPEVVLPESPDVQGISKVERSHPPPFGKLRRRERGGRSPSPATALSSRGRVGVGAGDSDAVANRLVKPQLKSPTDVPCEPAITIPRELTGSPNYPALVRGEVLVMERPDFSQDVRDKIVVCRQTDPSWVPVLGLIKGLIVERGGILSHAAIVCRELQVPSIIGVADATRLLRTGQHVTLDSAQGKVTVL